MNLPSILIAWLVTAISLLIVSKLPIGVEIDSFGKALIAAAVFGILNAIVHPILIVLGFPFIVITLGLFLFVINAIVFGLAAALVSGFRLRYGFWSALLGAFLLGLVNSLSYQVLAIAGLGVKN
ncbi:MAG: phage holin family protein [Hydrococcus sp. C42_A2020_068]|uniref:phage holin family protein n=1 Tax=Pleurocapsa sp. PCC 7327 TaxID=118163 RepID=UPI00029FE1A2|nr:phage holin family protein [Pleurocapsa sp. PCC 7327]AFY76403.1 putative membrane protein [Pleurocapsa sp. PCC 7327]MBF2018793.1 phage holin family protein [Hydrococcus sp. C42_A2020_068]